MSAEVVHGGHGHGHGDSLVHHQFEDYEQQSESYIVGMWSFLVTEIMFFGALFLIYAVYRLIYPSDFAEVSRTLDITLGFINTLILLTSSLTMALAVRESQLKRFGRQNWFLLATVLLACGFLVVKGFEYGHKFHENHVPGTSFQWEHKATPSSEAEGAVKNASRADPTPIVTPEGAPFATEPTSKARPYIREPDFEHRAQLFLGLYFTMTGLHGIHVIIGIGIMVVLMLLTKRGHPAMKDHVTIEMAGLYWHFVDIVWIFLFPMLYLIHPAPLFGGG